MMRERIGSRSACASTSLFTPQRSAAISGTSMAQNGRTRKKPVSRIATRVLPLGAASAKLPATMTSALIALAMNVPWMLLFRPGADHAEQRAGQHAQHDIAERTQRRLVQRNAGQQDGVGELRGETEHQSEPGAEQQPCQPAIFMNGHNAKYAPLETCRWRACTRLLESSHAKSPRTFFALFATLRESFTSGYGGIQVITARTG